MYFSGLGFRIQRGRSEAESEVPRISQVLKKCILLLGVQEKSHLIGDLGCVGVCIM